MQRYLNSSQYDSTRLANMYKSLQYYCTELDTFPTTTLSLVNNLENLTDVITYLYVTMHVQLSVRQKGGRGRQWNGHHAIRATELANLTDLTTMYLALFPQ